MGSCKRCGAALPEYLGRGGPRVQCEQCRPPRFGEKRVLGWSTQANCANCGELMTDIHGNRKFCVVCAAKNEYNHRWHLAHPASRAAADHQRYLAHREEVIARSAAWLRRWRQERPDDYRMWKRKKSRAARRRQLRSVEA